MAFLDDLKKNLTDKGLEAAQKAKDTAEVLQLRVQITGQKNQLEKLESTGKMSRMSMLHSLVRLKEPFLRSGNCRKEWRNWKALRLAKTAGL